MRIFITATTLIILFHSCYTSSTSIRPTFRDSIPITSFCNLPKHSNQLVFVKALYSGIDEYWSLRSVDKKCSDLKVNLEYAGPSRFNSAPPKYDSLFRYVSENYHKTYLLLELVGKFDNSNKEGYGHMNYNNSRFIVSEIVSASMLQK